MMTPYVVVTRHTGIAATIQQWIIEPKCPTHCQPMVDCIDCSNTVANVLVMKTAITFTAVSAGSTVHQRLAQPGSGQVGQAVSSRLMLYNHVVISAVTQQPSQQNRPWRLITRWPLWRVFNYRRLIEKSAAIRPNCPPVVHSLARVLGSILVGVVRARSCHCSNARGQADNYRFHR